jgi:hypothetical protein
MAIRKAIAFRARRGIVPTSGLVARKCGLQDVILRRGMTLFNEIKASGSELSESDAVMQ